jgi:hypothetical protein
MNEFSYYSWLSATGKLEDFSLSFGISPHQDKEGCGHSEKCPVSEAFSADLTSSPVQSPPLQTISSTRTRFIDKIV